MTEVLQSQWFEALAPARGRLLELFCFPYAGGSAQVFRPWQRLFSREVCLSLVHLPGRAKRINEPPCKRLKPLIDAVADAMIPSLPDSFAFWGHSMGAVISFELARELRRRGHSGPLALFVSGRLAPHLPNPDPPTFTLPEAACIAESARLSWNPREL